MILLGLKGRRYLAAPRPHDLTTLSQTLPPRLDSHAAFKSILEDLDRVTMKNGEEEIVSEQARALPSSVTNSIDSSFGIVNALGSQ